MSVYILPVRDVARPVSPAMPLAAGLIVSRLVSDTVYDACSLCWIGPCQLVGTVRERWEPDASARPICSRCLVTLEMLAVQFGPELRLQLVPVA